MVLCSLQDFSGKLTDFGLAKDGPDPGQTHVSTQIMGTMGYLDPRYAETGMGIVHSRHAKPGWGPHSHPRGPSAPGVVRAVCGRSLRHGPAGASAPCCAWPSAVALACAS